MYTQLRTIVSKSGVSTLLFAMCAGVFLNTPNAVADSIVFRGVLYEDVLIYKGSASYYVKIPDEGYVFNASVDEVHPSQVRMVYDPYYRDELKRRFEEAKKRVQSGEVLKKRGSKNSFSLTDSGGESSVADLLGAGGDDTGLGLPLEAIQSIFEGAGMAVSRVGNIITATTPGDDSTIKLYGNPDYLSKIEINSSVAEAQKDTLKMGIMQMQILVSGLVPWFGPWLQSNMKLLDEGGTAEKTQDGRHVLFDVTLSNGQVTVKLMIESV